LPAEEGVPGRLHQPLAVDDSLATGPVRTCADEPFQDRPRRLLRLQEQCVLAVTALERQDPDPGADAADANDFPGGMDVLEALEQPTTIGLEGSPAGPDQGPQVVVGRRAFPSAVGKVLERDDEPWVGDDPTPTVDLAGEFLGRLHAVG